jgi:hypothetical protein
MVKAPPKHARRLRPILARVGSTNHLSGTLAPAIARPSGAPAPSTSTERLVPPLARSVGLRSTKALKPGGGSSSERIRGPIDSVASSFDRGCPSIYVCASTYTGRAVEVWCQLSRSERIGFVSPCQLVPFFTTATGFMSTAMCFRSFVRCWLPLRPGVRSPPRAAVSQQHFHQLADQSHDIVSSLSCAGCGRRGRQRALSPREAARRGDWSPFHEQTRAPSKPAPPKPARGAGRSARGKKRGIGTRRNRWVRGVRRWRRSGPDGAEFAGLAPVKRGHADVLRLAAEARGGDREAKRQVAEARPRSKLDRPLGQRKLCRAERRRRRRARIPPQLNDAGGFGFSSTAPAAPADGLLEALPMRHGGLSSDGRLQSGSSPRPDSALTRAAGELTRFIDKA